MDTTIALERESARAVAEEYRSKGYEVIEKPSPKQLPEFLSAYQPDMLVRKGDESIIVEVKARSSLGKDSRIVDLARLLQEKAGWNFELIIVGEGEKLRLPENARPLEREDILDQIEEAERLLQLSHYKAAFLTAWAASEAAIRLLLEEEDVSLEKTAPSYILGQAVSEGVISRGDYSSLVSAMKFRNALVHGFKSPGLDLTIIGSVLSTTKRLLQLEASS